MKQSFHDLFVHLLSEMHNAEIQVIEMAPRVARAATNNDLREALDHHLRETKEQKKRLDRIFKLLGISPEEVFSEGMSGLLQETEKVMRLKLPPAVIDAGIISCTQKIEHYQIAMYGTLRTFAKHLELEEIQDLLQETLNEEGKSNKELTKLAEGGLFWSGINVEAAAAKTNRK